MKRFCDDLVERCEQRRTRLVVGLDPELNRFPEALRQRLRTSPDTETLEEALVAFLTAVIDATRERAAAYKPQAAFFEQYGLAGMRALERVLGHLHALGELIILDGKRNDVAHTADAYAQAWLAPRHPVWPGANPWRADAVTLNGYLGSDGIQPFLRANQDAGVFVLVKTSNPSSGELQDRLLADGRPVYELMAELVNQWGKGNVGYRGFANVGMVVGATWPHVAARLRALSPQALFLMPGVGPQGGSLEAIVAGSRSDGHGALAAASRGVSYPFQPEAFAGDDWRGGVMDQVAAAAEALRLAIHQRLG